MSGDKGGTSRNKGAASYNFVSRDQIWKDHVHHEESATKTWPTNWGFLTTKYEDLVRDDFSMKNTTSKPDLPAALQCKPVTPIDEYITVESSPKPVPNTSAKHIGWRSSERRLALEKYGRYTRPKAGLVNQLQWPHEAID